MAGFWVFPELSLESKQAVCDVSSSVRMTEHQEMSVLAEEQVNIEQMYAKCLQ